MADIAAFVPDLMDRSKVAGAVPHVRFASDFASLSGAATVLLDMSRPGAVEAAAALVGEGARVIGFASHVDEATIAAARAVGAEVLARSVFFRRLCEMVR